MGISYYPECIRSVCDITGALRVILFASQTNITASKSRRGGEAMDQVWNTN